jgi:hypothetical protein
MEKCAMSQENTFLNPGVPVPRLSLIKKMVFLSVLTVSWICSFSFSDSIHAQCIPPPSGLVSWWPGDNSAIDIAGNNNGTLMNGATFAPGMVGQAFSFDGVDDYVNVGNLSLPITFTIDAWIKPVVTVDLQWILAKDNPSANQRSFFFYLDNAGVLGLFVRNGNGQDTFYETGSSAAVVGEWTHVAAVYDGNATAGQKIKFYVNGQSMAATYFSGVGGTPETNSVDTLIGKHPVYPSFNGLIDEVEIFNRALSQAEIQAIYNAGSAGKCRSCTAPPSGMVSWWGGDNNALDMIGTNHGTLQGGATFAPGMVGQAFSFDGVDDYIEVPHSASLNLTGGLTLETWFKVRSAGYATLFSKSDSNGSQSVTSYGFQIDPDGSINVALYGTYPADNWTTAAGLVTTGQWYHVALTWDGTYGPSDNVKLYLNGALVQTWTKSLAPLNVTTQTLTLGSMKPPTYYGHMDGLIDEAGIFNRALSAEEIAAIYAAGSAGKCIPTCVQSPSGMVSWWKGQDNANDSIGGNNGTLVNGPTFADGRVGRAFNFGGSDDYVQALSPVGLPVGNSPRTIMLWFKTPSNWGDSYQVVIQYGGNSPGSKFGIYIPDYWSRTLSFWGEQSDFAGSTPLQLNTWYHGAVTYDGSVRTLYLNGQYETSLAQPLNTQINAGGFTIGRTSSFDNITSQWNGLVDEAMIFNRALSAEEIAAIYAAGSAGICDDGDGVPPLVEDAAPNNGDGNGDGVPDSQQAHVASLPSATGSGYVTVVVSGGCSQIQSVATYTAASRGNDPNFDYPYGLVGFTIPCSAATVKVIFHNAANLNGFTYRKFGPTPPAFNNPQWYTLPGVTFGTEVIGGQTVATATFTLTDGQLGDDTDVDGFIVDQGGPGLPADQTGPSLQITSHTNNQDVNTASITLSGTASDSGKGDNGIQQVTVNGVEASNDTATGSGTANWSKVVSLSPGANTLTVVAYDDSSSHNQTSQTITIFYDLISTIYVSKDGVCNGHSHCWPNIENGISQASDPSIIEITQETYDEDIVLDVDKEIILEGGWDTNFASCSSYTTIKGSMTITHGTIIIENIILK